MKFPSLALLPPPSPPSKVNLSSDPKDKSGMSDGLLELPPTSPKPAEADFESGDNATFLAGKQAVGLISLSSVSRHPNMTVISSASPSPLLLWATPAFGKQRATTTANAAATGRASIAFFLGVGGEEKKKIKKNKNEKKGSRGTDSF